MSEINHRWLKDNDGDRFFPVTHLDTVQGSIDEDWIEFDLINGAEKNTEYSENRDKGFVCSYKIIDLFGLTIKSIRFNGRKMKSGQVIANIPDLTDHAQSFYLRTPGPAPHSGVTMRPDGEILFLTKDSSKWNTETDYIYGQHTWIE